MSPPLLAGSRRLRRTPFSPRVEALGAKAYSVYNHMLLPAVFRSLAEDYEHLKQHVQLWDVSCERQVEIDGPDAASLIQWMTPRDLSKAVVGQCLYAPIVDQAGGMLNDPIILKLAEDRFWLSIADSDILLWAKGLAAGRAFDVQVTEPDVWPLAVQGPKAEDLMAIVFGEVVREIRFFRFRLLPFRDHPLVVSRSGWSKQGGFEIYVDDAALGLELWDALWQAGEAYNVGPGCPNLIERIEGGLLSYGNDMTCADTPLHCGLDRYCHLDRPLDHLGREALQALQKSGVDRAIRGLTISGEAIPTLLDAWPIEAEGRKIGQVSSAAYSPHLGTNIAIAMIAQSHWRPGTAVEVSLPGEKRAATVAALPFI